MGRKCGLTTSEKLVITSGLAKGKSTLEMAKVIGRYHQTVKGFVAAPMKDRKRADKGHSGVLTQRLMARIKCEAVSNPSLTSGELFRRMGETNVPRTTRCRLLKRLREEEERLKGQEEEHAVKMKDIDLKVKTLLFSANRSRAELSALVGKKQAEVDGLQKQVQALKLQLLNNNQAKGTPNLNNIPPPLPRSVDSSIPQKKRQALKSVGNSRRKSGMEETDIKGHTPKQTNKLTSKHTPKHTSKQEDEDIDWM